ncbi:hypothetical protein [Clostridium sartagoforme]|uniref:hypothetical protein n=1 Tax=Clostridium sartagoforme TaxID=84031 RepID=UPI0031D3D5B4
MKVKIVNILEKDNEYYVKIKSDYGAICGVWKEGKPILNKDYYIEFSVEEPLELNKNLFINNNNNNNIHSIFMENDKIILNGQYDSLDEDGCLAIKLGKSIILLDYITNKENINITDCNLMLKLSSIQIFNTNLI